MASPHLKITTGEHKPLFDVLKGDSNPLSPCTLTLKATQALALVETAINQQHVSYFSPDKPLSFLIFPTPFTPTGPFWQNDPLYWVHLSASPGRVLLTYPCLVSQLIRMGREHSIKLFGKDLDILVLPYTPSQVQWLTQNEDAWAINLISFQGLIDNHFPANRLVQFFLKTPVIFPKITKRTPLNDATLVFTDGSSTGRAAYSIDGKIFYFQTLAASAQIVELLAIIKVFQTLTDVPFNLYTDSAYLPLSVPCLETIPYRFHLQVRLHCFQLSSV